MYYAAFLFKNISWGDQLQWRASICFRRTINNKSDVCVLTDSQGIVFLVIFGRRRNVNFLNWFSDVTQWKETETRTKLWCWIIQGERNCRESRKIKRRKHQTHLIATATKMIIIPTETMAMMTPHMMYQTLFGSSIKKIKTQH